MVFLKNKRLGRQTVAFTSPPSIAAGSCVISSTGALVGVVSEVGANYCRVSTVISPDIEMGGL